MLSLADKNYFTWIIFTMCQLALKCNLDRCQLITINTTIRYSPFPNMLMTFFLIQIRRVMGRYYTLANSISYKRTSSCCGICLDLQEHGRNSISTFIKKFKLNFSFLLSKGWYLHFSI